MGNRVAKVIPCKFSKPGNDKGGFMKQSQAWVRDAGCEVASTVTAHYWRGLSMNGDNCVIVVEANETE